MVPAQLSEVCMKKMSIHKATIRIDLLNYLKGILRCPGYIDGSDVFLDPNDDCLISSHDDVEEAEAELDRTVHLSITENEAVIEYEYIEGLKAGYFDKVEFLGEIYPVDDQMYSESCYYAIVKYLKSV